MAKHRVSVHGSTGEGFSWRITDESSGLLIAVIDFTHKQMGQVLAMRQATMDAEVYTERVDDWGKTREHCSVRVPIPKSVTFNRAGKEAAKLNLAIRNDPQIAALLADDWQPRYPDEWNGHNYFDDGTYSVHLDRWVAE